VPCYEDQYAQRCAKCNGVSLAASTTTLGCLVSLHLDIITSHDTHNKETGPVL